MPDTDFMTTEEIAAWLRTNRYSIYRYLKQGMLNYRLGVKRLFKRAEVEAWMREQAEATKPKPAEHIPAALLPEPKPVRRKGARGERPLSVDEAVKQLNALMK
jgi:excisionase family DNA binding protein